MKSKVLLGITSAVVMGGLAATAMADDRFEYHGYWRAGFVNNGEGGGSTEGGFQAPGANARYRLGQENNVYGENILVKTFEAGDNGPTAKFETLIAYATGEPQNDWQTPGWALREAFVEFTNLDFDKGANIWAGKRFYGREDIHINDFYWLDSSGLGAGIDNVSLSDTMKMNIGIIRGSSGTEIVDTGTDNKLGIDARLKVGMGDMGDLTFVVQPMYAKGGDVVTTTDGVSTTTSYDDRSGVGLSLIYGKGHSMGFNKAAVQWGNSVASSFSFSQWGMPSEADKDSSLFRVLDFGVIAPMDNFSFMYDVIYQDQDTGADTNNKRQWASVGVRPLYNVTKYFGIAVEAGVDYTKQEGAASDGGDLDGTVAKLTICPELRIDSNFWARPVLRGFVTLANWSSDFEGMVGGPAYTDKTSGMTWGFQMETWF